MVEQCSTSMHGRPRHLGWPIEQGTVPLWQPLLFFDIPGFSLEGNVFVVEAHFVEGRAFAEAQRHGLLRLTLRKPTLKLAVIVEVVVSSRYGCLRDVVGRCTEKAGLQP